MCQGERENGDLCREEKRERVRNWQSHGHNVSAISATGISDDRLPNDIATAESAIRKINLILSLDLSLIFTRFPQCVIGQNPWGAPVRALVNGMSAN
jgi:hypothetical protein